MKYLGKCFVWYWEESATVDGIVSIHLFGPFGLKYRSNPSFLYWFSVWMIFLLLKIDSCSYRHSVSVWLCFYLFPWTTNIYFIYLGVPALVVYICNCYIHLMNWSFYHCTLSLSPLAVSKLKFIYFKYSCPWSLSAHVYMEYIFLSFHFKSVSLKIKWVFYMQHICGQGFLPQLHHPVPFA